MKQDNLNYVKFPEHNIELGKDQPQYNSLPAHVDYKSAACGMTFKVKLTFRQRLKLLFTGSIWIQQLTFGKPFQPIKAGLNNLIGTDNGL